MAWLMGSPSEEAMRGWLFIAGLSQCSFCCCCCCCCYRRCRCSCGGRDRTGSQLGLDSYLAVQQHACAWLGRPLERQTADRQFAIESDGARQRFNPRAARRAALSAQKPRDACAQRRARTGADRRSAAQRDTRSRSRAAQTQTQTQSAQMMGVQVYASDWIARSRRVCVSGHAQRRADWQSQQSQSSQQSANRILPLLTNPPLPPITSSTPCSLIQKHTYTTLHHHAPRSGPPPISSPSPPQSASCPRAAPSSSRVAATRAPRARAALLATRACPQPWTLAQSDDLDPSV